MHKRLYGSRCVIAALAVVAGCFCAPVWRVDLAAQTTTLTSQAPPSDEDTSLREFILTLENIVKILEKNPTGLRQKNLAQEISNRGVSRATAYRRIEEAENSGLIKFSKGKGVYVIPE